MKDSVLLKVMYVASQNLFVSRSHCKAQSWDTSSQYMEQYLGMFQLNIQGPSLNVESYL